MAAPCKALLSWGANSYGQLGHGHTDDKLLPETVTNSPQNLVNIVGGGGHTIYISEGGACCGVGWNMKGQLSQPGKGNVLTPAPLEIPETEGQVVKVSAGWDFTLAVTSTGAVYGCGSNAWGQLGIDSKQTNHPVAIDGFPSRVVDVSCGMRHSLVLTENGEIFSSGSGKKGQLGLTVDRQMPPKHLNKFHKIRLPDDIGKVVQVTAGAYHSAALTDKGAVLLWGDNKLGQLGKEPSTSQINQPEVLQTAGQMPRNIIKIYSGWTHMVAMAENGELYSWGRGDYGQLGRPLPAAPDNKSTHIPWKVAIEQVTQVAVGSEHNLAITKSGKLYSWGWNEHGMCGTGDETDVLLPQVVPDVEEYYSLLCACGAGHSYVIVEKPRDKPS